MNSIKSLLLFGSNTKSTMSSTQKTYEKLFPYDSPRRSQKDGMIRIHNSIKNKGITSMEGACGTGKTLTALVPSINYIRDGKTIPQRVMVITSVKQQMEAFQAEVNRINENMDNDENPVSAITLSSILDFHPYFKQGLVDNFDELDKLRENARIITEDKGYTYDKLYQRAERQSTKKDEFAYPTNFIPSVDDVEYDPYYAKYRAEYQPEEENELEVIPFNLNSIGLLTVGDMRKICAEKGYCPHSIMRLTVPFTDVVICNFFHLFDSKTVERITNPIINYESILIVDEAHNLVPRVRNELSMETSIYSMLKAQNELEEIDLLLELSNYNEKEIRKFTTAALKGETDSMSVEGNKDIAIRIQEAFSKSGSIVSNLDDIIRGTEAASSVISESHIVNKENIRNLKEYLEQLCDKISHRIDSEMPLQFEDSICLRESPKRPEHDDISDWTLLNPNFSGNPMRTAHEIGQVVHLIRNNMKDEESRVKTSTKTVGSLLTSWTKKDHIRYYRSLDIEQRYKIPSIAKYSWQDEFKVLLKLNNCLPQDEISAVLNKFYSVTLMSATLEPIDVFHKTTGIDKLKEDGRNVYECSYGLAFDKDNRLTLGVSADKYNYSNRKKAFNQIGNPSLDNPTREEYKKIIFQAVKNTPGNTLIVMPNYTEAAWIGKLLKQDFSIDSNEVFIDEPSNNYETTQIKEAFFNSESGILTTGARGTLIEGVDYIGDKLHSVIICGVPITNTASDYKKAIQASYDEVFDEDGFKLAFTIPAIWKTRQAMGRVIRTKNDIGTRILVDERYVEKSWNSVKNYLSEDERKEMNIVNPEDVGLTLSEFWDSKNINNK